MKRHSKMAWVEALRTAVAIGIALLIVFVIVLCVSSEPLNAIFNFLFGPLTTVRRMGNVVEEMIPIMFTGLSSSTAPVCSTCPLRAASSWVLW